MMNDNAAGRLRAGCKRGPRWPSDGGPAGAILVAIIVAFLFSPGASRAAPEHPCRDGFIEWLEKGDVTVCYGHLIQSETLAAYQSAVDKVTALETAKVALEAQLVNLRGELAEVRATGEALLAVCTNIRNQCEASRMPPKCPGPPFLERPAFVWPAALAVGFFGGFAFDRWVVK